MALLERSGVVVMVAFAAPPPPPVPPAWPEDEPSDPRPPVAPLELTCILSSRDGSLWIGVVEPAEVEAPLPRS
jgi:hypothetical protein